MFRMAAFHADKSTEHPLHQPCTCDALLMRFQRILSAPRRFRDFL